MDGERYDRLVFIGRFQPLHAGHLAVLRRGLEQAARVSVLIGSARQPRSLRNPFTVAERQQMFELCLSADERARIDFGAVEDVLYDDEIWCRLVRREVAAHGDEARTGIIGHDKDASSYYLRSFPDWPLLSLPLIDGLHATPLRESLLAAGPAGAREILDSEPAQALPESVRDWLRDFVADEAFAALCEEHRAVAAFRAGWAGSPYAPTFVTADTLLEHDGHVLLIRRGRHPGVGQLALPGGFVDADEPLVRTASRELAEETAINMDELDAELVSSGVYDHPLRSVRGRFFTHVYHYRLAPGAPRPQPRAGDDAAEAGWHEIATLDPAGMFEDHYCVIQHRLGLGWGL